MAPDSQRVISALGSMMAGTLEQVSWSSVDGWAVGMRR